jgi:ABC-2 type transport system ATP-binding protein
MNIIECDSIRKDWGPKVAVESVSLKIPSGAVFALVGPNGAGKTTLLKILAGLIEPSSGSGKIFGLDLQAKRREIQSKLGFLPDFFELYRDLTVREYLEYFARAYRIPESEKNARISALLEKVKLLDRRDAIIDTLSRGMRQRVAIARALINEPNVLLFDEPASGLDPEARQDLQNLFKELASEGRTMLVSSHILTELEEYCTHVAIMQKGKLVASGPIDSFQATTPSVRTVRMRVLSDVNQCKRMLETISGIAEVKVSGLEFTLSFSGDESAQSDLLRRVVQGGVQVSSFEFISGSMQEIYMSLMKGTSE